MAATGACALLPASKTASIGGGPAPVRAYIEGLLPNVLEGRIEPCRVFDRSGSLDDVPDGYRAMNERQILKFQIELCTDALDRDPSRGRC